MHPYLVTDKPHVLAHQGLALTCPANSLEAFKAAIDAGADFIETDAHGTKDGIAVLFHDDEIDGSKISDLNFSQLPVFIPRLDVALKSFPDSRFNIDIKNKEAALPVALAINELQAHTRVLLTSFSASRRKKTMKLAAGTASSPSVSEFVPVLLAGVLGLRWLVKKLLAGFDAVQIPARGLGINTVSQRLLQHYHSAGVVVHVWTINEPQHMKELVRNGVDGIVTDRTDIAVHTLKD